MDQYSSYHSIYQPFQDVRTRDDIPIYEGYPCSESCGWDLINILEKTKRCFQNNKNDPTKIKICDTHPSVRWEISIENYDGEFIEEPLSGEQYRLSSPHLTIHTRQISIRNRFSNLGTSIGQRDIKLSYPSYEGLIYMGQQPYRHVIPYERDDKSYHIFNKEVRCYSVKISHVEQSIAYDIECHLNSTIKEQVKSCYKIRMATDRQRNHIYYLTSNGPKWAIASHIIGNHPLWDWDVRDIIRLQF